MQGSHMRHAFVEGEARIRHGEDQDTTAGKGSGGSWNKTHPGQVCYNHNSFELTLLCEQENFILCLHYS